jgi:hypothetical protein
MVSSPDCSRIVPAVVGLKEMTNRGRGSALANQIMRRNSAVLALASESGHDDQR